MHTPLGERRADRTASPRIPAGSSRGNVDASSSDFAWALLSDDARSASEEGMIGRRRSDLQKDVHVLGVKEKAAHVIITWAQTRARNATFWSCETIVALALISSGWKAAACKNETILLACRMPHVDFSVRTNNPQKFMTSFS